MHKGIIMLVKAKDAEIAQDMVEEFLEPYGEGKVWDWYVIGGRWSGALGEGLDDVEPLSKCINKAKEWQRDVEKEADKFWEQMVAERMKEQAGEPGTMSAYFAGLYNEAKYNDFCFESNVFNVTEGEGELIPKDLKGWWAVMIDIHN